MDKGCFRAAWFCLFMFWVSFISILASEENIWVVLGCLIVWIAGAKLLTR